MGRTLLAACEAKRLHRFSAELLITMADINLQVGKEGGAQHSGGWLVGGWLVAGGWWRVVGDGWLVTAVAVMMARV